MGLVLAMALALASEISGHWHRWPNKTAFKCSRRCYASSNCKRQRQRGQHSKKSNALLFSASFLTFFSFFCTVFVGIKKDAAEIVIFFIFVFLLRLFFRRKQFSQLSFS